MEFLAYVTWVLVCAAVGAWYAYRQNRHKLDAKETGGIYALAGAIIGAIIALAILLLGWITS
jgi:hypothetical protein